MSFSYQTRDLIWWQRKLLNETSIQPLPVAFVDTKFGGSPAPFRQTLHYSVYKKDRSDNHTINLASDKCFGMVGTCQEGMEWNCAADRTGETCRYAVHNINGSSFRGLIVINISRLMLINISRLMKDGTLVVAFDVQVKVHRDGFL